MTRLSKGTATINSVYIDQKGVGVTPPGRMEKPKAAGEVYRHLDGMGVCIHSPERIKSLAKVRRRTRVWGTCGGMTVEACRLWIEATPTSGR